MTNPQLSIVQTEADPVPSPDGPAQVRLSGPVQVHIHLGHGAPGPAAPLPSGAAAPQSQRPVLLGLLALALAGGGYLAGSRSTPPPPSVSEVGMLAADPAPNLLPPTPALPGPPGEIPPALRQQLARPPVVSPPPGSPASSPSAGAVPAAPARNAFGLGN